MQWWTYPAPHLSVHYQAAALVIMRNIQKTNLQRICDMQVICFMVNLILYLVQIGLQTSYVRRRGIMVRTLNA